MPVTTIRHTAKCRAELEPGSTCGRTAAGYYSHRSGRRVNLCKIHRRKLAGGKAISYSFYDPQERRGIPERVEPGDCKELTQESTNA